MAPLLRLLAVFLVLSWISNTPSFGMPSPLKVGKSYRLTQIISRTGLSWGFEMDELRIIEVRLSRKRQDQSPEIWSIVADAFEQGQFSRRFVFTAYAPPSQSSGLVMMAAEIEDGFKIIIYSRIFLPNPDALELRREGYQRHDEATYNIEWIEGVFSCSDLLGSLNTQAP